jgi:uncharacterized membrane protein YuzA (DUF378 family)
MEVNLMLLKIAEVLLLVGGLSLGLVGLLGFDTVTSRFGAGSLLVRIIFIFVGLSALYLLLVVTGVFTHPAPEGFSIHINTKN